MAPPSLPQDNTIDDFPDIKQLETHADEVEKLLLDSIYSFKVVDLESEEAFFHDKNISVSQISPSEKVIKFDEPMFLKRVTIKSNSVKYIKVISKRNKPLETQILQATGSFELNTVAYGLVIPKTHLTTSIFGKPLSFFTDEKLFGDFLSAIKESQNKAIQYMVSINSAFNTAKQETIDNENYVKSLKNEIKTLNSEKKVIGKDIETTKKYLSEIRANVAEKTDQHERVVDDYKSLTESIKELNRQRSGIEKSQKESQEKLEVTENEITSKKSQLTSIKKELSDLENNKDVISLDTKGFNEASRLVLKNYYIGVGCVFFVFIVLAGFMFVNAFDYIDISQSYNKTSAFELLISRLPMAAATIVILGCFSTLVIVLTKNIIQINRERINILKASIMARQIGDSLPTNISREDREALVTSTKLELIMRLLQDNTNENSASSADQVIEILKATQSNNQ